jgi:hypothetical protein
MEPTLGSCTPRPYAVLYRYGEFDLLSVYTHVNIATRYFESESDYPFYTEAGATYD